MSDTELIFNPFSKKLDNILSIVDGGSPSTGTNFTLDGGAYNTVNTLVVDAGTAAASGGFLVDGGTL